MRGVTSADRAVLAEQANGVRTIAWRTVGVWWRSWPRLSGIYLLGWFLRYWAMQGAITVGMDHGMVWGTIVLSLAPIVRLVTYLAMFLVIRSEVPELAHAADETGRPRGFNETMMSAILPFFVIYTAWKLIVEDYYTYSTTVQYSAVNELSLQRTAEIVGTGSTTALWAVVAVAFTARQVISRFRDRLPGAATLVAVYLDVLWIFLVIQMGMATLFGTPAWVAQRRVVVWFNDQKDALFDHFSVLGQMCSAAGGSAVALVTVLGLSLMWLAIANAVYGSPLEPTWAGARAVLLGRGSDIRAQRAIERGRRAVLPRWQRVPATIRDRTVEFGREQLGRFGPIADAGKLIMHGGATPIAFFVLAFTVLVLLVPNGAYFDRTVTDGHLWRALALVLGPHEFPWWNAVADTIRACLAALVEPIRICLVAATYWFCIDQVRRHSATETPSASVGLEPDQRP